MKISLHMHVATLFLGCVWNKYVANFFFSFPSTQRQDHFFTSDHSWSRLDEGRYLPTLNLKTKKILSTLKLKKLKIPLAFQLSSSLLKFSIFTHEFCSPNFLSLYWFLLSPPDKRKLKS